MKPSSKQRSSISGVVTTADTGMPPPSVFDRTRKSGTTSKTSKPYSEPSLPSPVWHSSSTRCIPRSSQSSAMRVK